MFPCSSRCTWAKLIMEWARHRHSRSNWLTRVWKNTANGCVACMTRSSDMAVCQKILTNCFTLYQQRSLGAMIMAKWSVNNTCLNMCTEAKKRYTFRSDSETRTTDKTFMFRQRPNIYVFVSWKKKNKKKNKKYFLPESSAFFSALIASISLWQ